MDTLFLPASLRCSLFIPSFLAGCLPAVQKKEKSKVASFSCPNMQTADGSIGSDVDLFAICHLCHLLFVVTNSADIRYTVSYTPYSLYTRHCRVNLLIALSRFFVGFGNGDTTSLYRTHTQSHTIHSTLFEFAKWLPSKLLKSSKRTLILLHLTESTIAL